MISQSSRWQVPIKILANLNKIMFLAKVMVLIDLSGTNICKYRFTDLEGINNRRYSQMRSLVNVTKFSVISLFSLSMVSKKHRYLQVSKLTKIAVFCLFWITDPTLT